MTAKFLPALLLLSFVFVTPSARADKPSDLDRAASKIAGKIRKDAPRASQTPPRIYVAAFHLAGDPENPVGTQLAAEFSGLLQKYLSGFTFLTPAEFDRILAEKNLPASYAFYPPMSLCSGSSLGIDFFVTGAFSLQSAGARLDLTISPADPRRHSFTQQNVAVSLTPAMRALAAGPSPPSTSPISAVPIWVSQDHPPVPDSDVIPLANPQTAKGNTLPACVYCPSPLVSPEQANVPDKMTVYFQVQISADGYPARISLMYSDSCEFTSKALAALKTWRFHPAETPAGKPIACLTVVEIQFRVD